MPEPDPEDEVMMPKAKFSQTAPERKHFPTFEDWVVARRQWCRWKARWDKIYAFSHDKEHIVRQSMDGCTAMAFIRVPEPPPKPKRRKK